MGGDLNESQRRIAETLDGMIVVDAGPGTGKTHTIVQRYINLISRENIEPRDILLMTFTNNAADELEERIKTDISKTIKESEDESLRQLLERKSKLVQVKTFDAFCKSVVMESPEDAGQLFGIDERLSRGATLESNDTINRQHFSQFLDRFLNERGDDYGDWAAIASQSPKDLLDLINKLMSHGIFPLRNGWFGFNIENELYGDPATLLDRMTELNVVGPKGGKSKMAGAISKIDTNDGCDLPDITNSFVDPEKLEQAAYDESRHGLVRMVHDIFREYIRRCIVEDHLTFGINAMLAFSLLYNDKGVRERNSFKYVMIDEFQDTNTSQLMITLMILSQPNLCVVGDWKQGIYGFRYVFIENITDFENRVLTLRKFLNYDVTRVRISVPDVVKLTLDENYRSSEIILDTAFDSLRGPGKIGDTSLDLTFLDLNVHPISASRCIPDEHTAVRYVMMNSQDEESESVVRAVRDYVDSGNYSVHTDEGIVPMGYGDIAVLCRTLKQCRKILESLTEAGIPAYMAGDMDIMSTREGKLVLAWLRYINNDDDYWGYLPILADLGYPLAECWKIRNDKTLMPDDIRNLRTKLRGKLRRITELITSIFDFYGLNNEITQAITTVLSTAHRNSLLTVSDIVRLIEEGIENGATYNVENSIETAAVRIMTMHKSKGLEFPTVIIPYMDRSSMPSVPGSDKTFVFDSVLGIRSTKEVGHFENYSKICRSWKTALAKATRDTDYNEERRLMFVSLSRAGQYITLICGDKRSSFMDHLSKGEYVHDIPLCPPRENFSTESASEKPDVSGYHVRQKKIGVHSIMNFDSEDGQGGMAEDLCEFGRKGNIEHGTDVHKAAQAIFEGWPLRREYEDFIELEMIRTVIDQAKSGSRNAGKEAMSEVDCTLPVPECGIVLSGRIDLLAEYEDRVEIHDYKTDDSDRFESEYMLQLSVYALAAERFFGKRAVCSIDYVYMGYSKQFEPFGMEKIVERVESYQERMRSVANPTMRGSAKTETL